jgi:simple sugar transport system ATP-binding protein
MRGIEKRFGALRAIDGASLDLTPGRVHAIVGENGAGKSTLLSVAAGLLRPDAGELRIDDRRIESFGPHAAASAGIGIVHQHFSLVPTLTGLENLALGSEPTRWGWLALGGLRRRAESLLGELGLSVTLDVAVGTLSVADRQRLEILRAMTLASATRPARVMIFDEPTAVLAPPEAAAVLALLRTLGQRGVAVALVTHHLDEVVAVADEVTVMKRGKVVARHDPVPNDAAALARQALGELPELPPRARESAGKTSVVLALDDVAVEASDAEDAPHEGAVALGLAVAAGEVVAVAGVSGNGQRALELLVAGLAAPRSGRLRMFDRDAAGLDVAQRRAAGLAWIPSDRHRHAIVESLSAREVAHLGALGEIAHGRGLAVLDEAAAAASHARMVAALDVRPTDGDARVGSLSGGNQQKLVVARELRAVLGEGASGAPPKLVLACEPTRGIDALAAARVRSLIVSAARAGAGVLLISSDLDELRALADRIVVLRGGRVVATLAPDASRDALGRAMLGSASPEDHASRAAVPS